MFAEVKVVSPAEYQQWYKDKQAAIQQAASVHVVPADREDAPFSAPVAALLRY